MSDSAAADVTASTGLELVTLVVRDYDEAIAWFTNCLRFTLLEDTPLGDGKRWVRIANPGNGAALLLAKAVGDTQIAAIGNQTGGRVGFFLTVTDFGEMFSHMQRNGVLFEGAPRTEPYGQVIVFQDLYGNRWDLLGPQRRDVTRIRSIQI
jgi:catechol 2,3-dioxygenase-like lactoylglutathione lyase family enzyme